MAAARDYEDRGSSTRDNRELLIVLRRDGPMTVDELVHRLGMSRVTVLRSLRALSADGLITRQSERHGVGRPRLLYDASPMGRGTVPGPYEEVATSLLDAAREVGGHVLLAKMFDARGRSLARTHRHRLEEHALAAAPLVEQARDLAAAQNELGYVAEVLVDGDVALLCEYNCPVFELVERSHAVCEAELVMIAEVLRASVTREEHIASGARRCSFRLEPRVWDAGQMAALAASAARRPPSTPGWSSVQMRPARDAGPVADTGNAGPRASSRTRSWTSGQVAWPRDARPSEAEGGDR